MPQWKQAMHILWNASGYLADRSMTAAYDQEKRKLTFDWSDTADKQACEIILRLRTVILSERHK